MTDAAKLADAIDPRKLFSPVMKVGDYPEWLQAKRDNLIAAADFIRAHAWRGISEAREDPDAWLWVYCPPHDGLPAMACPCRWHPEAGFCVDELRSPTLFVELGSILPRPPQEESKG